MASCNREKSEGGDEDVEEDRQHLEKLSRLRDGVGMGTRKPPFVIPHNGVHYMHRGLNPYHGLSDRYASHPVRSQVRRYNCTARPQARVLNTYSA